MNNFKLDELKPTKINKTKVKELRKTGKLIRNYDHLNFRDPEMVAFILAQAILDGDRESFTDIIMAHLDMVNKEELSRRSKVPIATIRRIAAGANFNVENLLKITKALKEAS